MGDCRVKIVIAKNLDLAVDAHANGDDNNLQPPKTTIAPKETISFAKMWSSDTTIREVMEDNPTLWKLLSCHNNATTTRLWDMTVYPPVDITLWPLQDFPDLQGPKSKTLHSAGWFPSGTILAIPCDMTPNQFSDPNRYEDAQYNRQEQTSQQQTQQEKGDKQIEFVDPSLQSGGASKPLPSQVMSSVANRFELDQVMNNDDEATRRAKALLQEQSKRERMQREQKRTAKLDARIAQLEQQQAEGKKNQKVSDQVLRMLVKSRATGDKNLKMMDRIYFQCVLLRETDDHADGIMTKEYRFFSPQDTFAKIANVFACPSSNTGDELLSEVLCLPKGVVASGEDDKQPQVYRRFPVTMRVYEAMANGYLTDSRNEVNTLIVRWYRDRNDSTPSILDAENQDGEQPSNDATSASLTHEPTTVSAAGDKGTSKDEVEHDSMSIGVNGDDANEFEDAALRDAIKAMDGGTGKKQTKKASASATKVQQMKMKSKAKGDTKRIPKVENRVFLEVVTVSDKWTTTSGYYFLAKADPIERILQYCAETNSPAATPCEWEFLVPTEKEECFQHIQKTSMTVQEAGNQNILLPFGRLILRQHKL